MALNLVIARHLGSVIPPLALSLARWATTAVLVLPFVPIRSLRTVSRRDRHTLVLLALLGGAGTVAPQYVAARLTSAAHVGLAFATTPLLVALIERLIWRQRLHPRLAAGAGLALSGMALVVGNGASDAADLAGDALAVVGTIAWAGYTTLLRHRPPMVAPLLQLWVVATGGMLLLTIPAAVETTMLPAWQLDRVTAGRIVLLALVSSIAVYLTYGALVRRAGPSLASMSMFLVPLYAILGGALLLAELPEGVDWIGAALISGGILLRALPVKHVSRSSIG